MAKNKTQNPALQDPLETKVESVEKPEVIKMEDTKEFKDLMVKTAGELKASLVKLDFMGAEFMSDKKAMVATILTLKKKVKEKDEAVSEVANANVASQPAGEVSVAPAVPRNDLRIWSTKTAKFKEYCETQPKVSTMIPFEIGEKPGAYAELQINGMKLNVMKGVYVDLPQPFADLVRQSWQQTSDAGKEISMDRIDEKTGLPYRDSVPLI